jgi:pimeloyl-ACP methyl ester carboxylesterase
MGRKHTVTSGGMDLVVEEIGQGRPLVFAHGLTGNRAGVFEQLECLSDRFRVISYDQRGHGDSSPVRDPSLYDPHLMAEDMTSVMDALSVDHAVVGGESMGSATTLLFALAHPDRVDTILLTAPAFGDSPNADRENIWQMGDGIEHKGLDRYIDESAEDIRQKGLPKELAETMERRLRSHDRMSIALACKTVIDWQVFDDLHQIESCRSAACILAWKDDPLHPFQLAERMASLMPNATLREHDLGELFVRPASTGEIYAEFLGSKAKKAGDR